MQKRQFSFQPWSPSGKTNYFTRYPVQYQSRGFKARSPGPEKLPEHEIEKSSWFENLQKNLVPSNGNASETKANESFDNGVFFDIEAKRTPSKVSKLFSKRSEHIR
jgi:hypothetical protein